MYYNPNRDDEMLLRIKQSCIADPTLKVAPECKAFAREWIASSALGVEYKLRLSDKQRDFDIFNRIDELHRDHLKYLIDYYTSRERLIASFGGAIFYLDETLSAYNKGGDPHLLETLKEHGVRIGTNFRSENVGVFVANMALDSPFETFCRAGQENYLRIFCDYICYARYVAQQGHRFRSVNLILIPKESYSRSVHDSVIFVLEAEDISATADFIYPNLAKRFNFLERISRSANDIFMLIDDNLNVIYVNELFRKEFGKNLSGKDFDPLQEFMPALLSSQKLQPGQKNDFIVSLSLTNVSGRESLYSIYGQYVDGCGHKLCFIPSIPNGKAVGNTKTHYSFRSLVGSSRAFTEALETSKLASQSLSTVLLTGESGTGKELIAQAIHSASPRSSSPFIPVNCSAIPKDLIASEIMGFEDGAFTGARRGGQPGKFEIADGGTIFLDEISEMPYDMQSSLLRILEDHVINRVGSTKYTSIDVRVIAATNRDLLDCVKNGSFRLDLFYRLNVIRIDLPPLREREGDIALLVPNFLALSSYKNRLPLVTISPEVVQLFNEYTWPGNIRELKNVIERCVILSRSGIITLESLPRDIYNMLLSGDQPPAASISPVNVVSKYRDLSSERPDYAVKEYEANLIKDLLTTYDGNKSLVAKKLGISRSTLYKRMDEHGL